MTCLTTRVNFSGLSFQIMKLAISVILCIMSEEGSFLFGNCFQISVQDLKAKVYFLTVRIYVPLEFIKRTGKEKKTKTNHKHQGLVSCNNTS